MTAVLDVTQKTKIELKPIYLWRSGANSKRFGCDLTAWFNSLSFCWVKIFPWIKLFWYFYFIWDKLWCSIGSNHFSVSGCLTLIWKDSVTHLHGLAVHVKEGLLFAQGSSLENSDDSYLYLQLALPHFVSYFFFLHQSMPLSLWTIFNTILSKIYKVLSIKLSANVFVIGDLNIHHKDWLTYSWGTDRPSELYFNFSI